MNYSKKGIKERQKSLHASSHKWSKKLLLAVMNLMVLGILAIGVIGASAGIGVFKGIIDTAPSIENIDVTPTGFSTFVYDLEGNQIGKLIAQDSNRIPVAKDMIPENLAHAFVAIEDARFYEHNGIDIKGIIRAAYVGISNGFHFTEGASTITQQLLKNNVFTNWTKEDGFMDKIKRKIQEQYLAIELTKTMSKDDVLVNYMNTINLGQNTLGVQAASLRYFNKSVNTLTLSECAVIAGITQNPSKFNPISHPDNNAQRREKVLNDMLEQGYITQTEYDEAMADDVYSRIQIVNAEVEEDSVNTYFVDALTDDIMEDLMATGNYTETQAYTLLYRKGLTASTGMDALTHAIEGYTTKAAWEMTDMFHLKAIELISKSLRSAVANEKEGREGMALGEYIAGMGFSNVGLGIAHSMAHTLGAVYDTPHGVACAMMLPIVMEYNADCTGEKYREIARAMGVKGVDEMSVDEYRKAAIDAVQQLSVDVGIPTKLEALKEEDLQFLAESAHADACAPGNPKDASVEDLKALFRKLM